MPTVAQVISDCMLELAQVPGLAAQTYATPRLRKYVEDAFFLMFDDGHYWNSYLDRTTIAVANGVMSQDLTGARGVRINDYRDVVYIWPENSNKPLHELSLRVNAATLSGSAARYRAPSTAVTYRPFRIYPTGFTGNVDVLTHARPTQAFADNMDLYLDKVALAKGASFLYLAATGTNAGHAATLQAQFIARVEMLKAQENTVEVTLDTRQAYETTDEWREI